MSKQIKPVGEWIIVNQIPDYFKTDSGLSIVEENLTQGIVMAVSDDLKDIIKEGDKVVYPKSAGIAQYYNHKPCVWLNPNIHQPFGIVTEEKNKK